MSLTKPWDRDTVEIDGNKFRLQLNGEGKPYTLKRWCRANGGIGRWHWASVWAEWHFGLPTGIRARAIAELGFVWRNDSEATLGWHRADGCYLGGRSGR